MKNDIRARSFVTIMIVVALVAVAIRLSLDQIINFSISQNESFAQLNLKSLSLALENYARDHQGVYPENLRTLIQTTPAYLDRDYVSDSPVRGYQYICSRLESSTYSCSAVPVKCKLTGSTAYTVSTGGLLVAEECNKKE